MPNSNNKDSVIHIIDDDLSVLKVLQILLQGNGLACSIYQDENVFLGKEIGLQDCVITDVKLNDTTGIDLIRQLRVRGNHNPVLVITGYASIEVAVEAMKAGATDFLTKPFNTDELLGKIRAALAIAHFRGSEMGRRRTAAQKLDTLSEREVEVLGQVITGRTNRAISDILGISVKTVEAHRSHIMEKTGAVSLIELTRLWDAAGLPTSR